MKPTQASEVVRRNRTVQARELYMKTHGNFVMYKDKGSSFRVFKAPCEDCKSWRITGLMFFKWVKRTSNSKAFDRLIIHIVCYKCGMKSAIHTFDPADYKKAGTKEDPNPLWDEWKIKWHWLKS